MYNNIIRLSLILLQPKEIQEAIDQALGHFKRIDILINGAAGNFLCPASALSYNAFKTGSANTNR